VARQSAGSLAPTRGFENSRAISRRGAAGYPNLMASPPIAPLPTASSDARQDGHHGGDKTSCSSERRAQAVLIIHQGLRRRAAHRLSETGPTLRPPHVLPGCATSASSRSMSAWSQGEECAPSTSAAARAISLAAYRAGIARTLIWCCTAIVIPSTGGSRGLGGAPPRRARSGFTRSRQPYVSPLIAGQPWAKTPWSMPISRRSGGARSISSPAS